FVRDVQPLLANHCLKCHDAKKQKGGLRLDSREHALREGAIVPGRSAASTLVHRVAGIGDGKRMPPSGPGLSRKQIALLRAWIDQGAPWPASARLITGNGAHWSYRPLIRPALPAFQDGHQVRNPIDVFLQAR